MGGPAVQVARALPHGGIYIYTCKGVPIVFTKGQKFRSHPLVKPLVEHNITVFGQGLSPLSRWRLRIGPLPLERGPCRHFRMSTLHT